MTEQMSVTKFRIDHLPLGSKTRLHLLIDVMPDGSPLMFPTLVVRGSKPGKTLLATGMVHGDEYEGPIAIQDIFEELDPRQMEGTFFAIPVVNGPAMAAGTREGGWDHLNLARIFPCSATGSSSQRIADALTEHIYPQADLYADLHAGGNSYQIVEFAGYQLAEGPNGKTQREAAIAFDLPLVWGTSPLPGRSLSSAREKSIPAIYVEMTGEGRCRPDVLARTKQGVNNLLAYLGVVAGTYPTADPQWLIEDATESGHLQIQGTSPTSGLFVACVSVWDRVAEGDRLGEVRHSDGRVLAEIHAPYTGRVLFLRTFPRVFSGDSLCYVLAC